MFKHQKKNNQKLTKILYKIFKKDLNNAPVLLYNYIEIKKGVKKMKKRLIKRLHELITLIVGANLEELDKIGLELIEIEKKVMQLKNQK